MSELANCEHKWEQANLVSVKGIKNSDVYLGKGRVCFKCNMVMVFDVKEASFLSQ